MQHNTKVLLPSRHSDLFVCLRCTCTHLLKYSQILFAFCLNTALWAFISKHFKTQSLKLLMYLKAALVLHFCLFKTAPSVLVWHFSMSPDARFPLHQACWFDIVASCACEVFFFYLEHQSFWEKLAHTLMYVYLRPSYRMVMESTGFFFSTFIFSLLITCLIFLYDPPGWQYVCNYYPFLFVCESSSCHQIERRRGNTLLFMCQDKNMKLN